MLCIPLNPAGPTAETPGQLLLAQPFCRMSPKFPGKAVNCNDANSPFDKTPPVLQNPDLSSVKCRKSPQTITLITPGIQDPQIWSKTSGRHRMLRFPPRELKSNKFSMEKSSYWWVRWGRRQRLQGTGRAWEKTPLWESPAASAQDLQSLNLI